MSTETKKENEAAINMEAKRTHLFTRQPLSTLGKIAFWALPRCCSGGRPVGRRVEGDLACAVPDGQPSSFARSSRTRSPGSRAGGIRPPRIETGNPRFAACRKIRLLRP